MTGGGSIDGGAWRQYDGGVTLFVILICMIGATGGLIFGYGANSGGVTSMDMFLKRFLTMVYRKASVEAGHENPYCKFDSHLLQFSTSSLYLTALVASFFVVVISKKFGRKMSIIHPQWICPECDNADYWSCLLDIRAGFCNQFVPVYFSKMGPAKLREALNIGFQMATTIGILAINLVNYATAKMNYHIGWGLSVGLAAVPAAMVTLGGLILPDSPNSLLDRRILQKIRGINNVDGEFQDHMEASEASKSVANPWKNIIERKNCLNSSWLSFSPHSNNLQGLKSSCFMHPSYSKPLDLVLTTFFNGKTYGIIGEGTFSKGAANFVVFLICAYDSGFAWSWGPLGWLVPSEIFP
ncbi:hypothetical protein Cgig2_019074 [Carnegiea gigantea]|uniref:Major facilitator superfamily (MFS) profile domain-containing protein n=1 Tax=Carnegiea gigantea TaxID=171969 RepID=A0A9Q1QGV1_9CARY|nr:hypothetical protein Cgig2_019074 [Carnegiea gigantea]